MQVDHSHNFLRSTETEFRKKAFFTMIIVSIVGFGSARGAREQKYEHRENRHPEGHDSLLGAPT